MMSEHGENEENPVAAETGPDEVIDAENEQPGEESTGALASGHARTEDVLEQDAVKHIDAHEVRMERSAAESINAQRVTMTNAAAKTIDARSVKLEQSGSAIVRAERITMNESSFLWGSAQDLRVTGSRALTVATGSATLESGNAIGILATGNLEAKGDVRAIFLTAGSVKSGGNVSTTFTPLSAAAGGAALAGVLYILRRLFSRS